MAQNNQAKLSGQLVFLSGESVPISGMWRSDHEACVDPPDLWLRKLMSFPPCARCGLDTSYFLLEEVLHISEDVDFQ